MRAAKTGRQHEQSKRAKYPAPPLHRSIIPRSNQSGVTGAFTREITITGFFVRNQPKQLSHKVLQQTKHLSGHSQSKSVKPNRQAMTNIPLPTTGHDSAPQTFTIHYSQFKIPTGLFKPSRVIFRPQHPKYEPNSILRPFPASLVFARALG